MRGKVVFLNFWASWCPPCRQEAPLLVAAWRKYRGEGVVFLGVNIQDDELRAREFLEEFGITYPNGIDRGSKIAVDYGVWGLPETFFIDRGGRITYKHIGVLLCASAIQGLAHELPTFPRIRLVSIQKHPWESASRILSVQVSDPSGREPVVGAQVLLSGVEKERGSALRLREHWLAPAPQKGIYQDRVEFPARGIWVLTVTVRGRYVGEAHFEVAVTGDLPEAVPLGDHPELYLGWRGWMSLVLDWGHLLGFRLWLGVTALALLTRRLPLRSTVALTWVALIIGVGTGFNKMEYGTPFAMGLSLFSWEVPRIFFGKEYIYTLTAKHLLILGASVVTVLLTRQSWRGNPNRTAIFRTLLLINLLIALAIGGAAAVLGLLHAIVLHFA